MEISLRPLITMDTAPTTSATTTTIYSLPPSQPIFFPPEDDSRSIDLSPLVFILALLAIITVPALVYTFFFSFRFPSNPFRPRQYYPSPTPSITVDSEFNCDTDVVSDLKYQKETHFKDLGSECPVCLSVFTDGEEIRQLSLCKHSFHATCIDMWLSNHSNCPICRAAVALKKPSSSSSPSGNGDLLQGVPDAAALV